MNKSFGLTILTAIMLFCFQGAALAQDGAASFRIEDAAVCQDVVDRMPVGGGDVFPKEVKKLFCFTRVVGAPEETEIIHNWYHQGSLKASVKLRVGSANWRTWSVKEMSPKWAGEWMVEVISVDGTPLESIIFFVQ